MSYEQLVELLNREELMVGQAAITNAELLR
jgi:hypothetical protein